MPAYRTRDTTSTHPLQVSTQQAPTVSIISPTPRSYTFSSHDLYVSPSSSPFQPDLKPLSLSPPPPRPLSPTSSITSDSSQSSSYNNLLAPPPQHTFKIPELPAMSSSSFLQQTTPVPSGAPAAGSTIYKRRKSLGGDPLERRPRKGDEDYVKRPENAFILFRRKCCEERDDIAGMVGPSPPKKQRQADLSKMISQQWKSLSPEERQHWEDLAKEKKKEHEAMYPNYVYRPQRTKPTKGKKSKGSRRGCAGESEQDTTDAESFACTLPVNLSSSSRLQHGRARSAPTPPPTYQTIHIPTVLMPSCPSSPSLYPAQPGRRNTVPRLSLDNEMPSSSMTYHSDDSFMPSSSFSHHDFDASLQNNEMFQGMFDLPGQTTPLNRSLSLASISIPNDESSMISPTHMISPTSSLGSTSPATPHQNFGPLDSLINGGFPSQQCMVLGSQDDMPFLDYHTYGWDNAAIWPSETGVPQDEYDINAIPPVELNIPDYCNEEIPSVGVNGSSSLAMAVGFPPSQNAGNGDESELFTGMFNYNEPMMW